MHLRLTSKERANLSGSDGYKLGGRGFIISVMVDNDYDAEAVPASYLETFEKCSILFKFKEDESFKSRNTLSISRLKI